MVLFRVYSACSIKRFFILHGMSFPKTACFTLQVSPPLVAFRETVFDAREAPEDTACRPVRIIKAKTPTGFCEIRVRASPMPSRMASLIEEMSDLFRCVSSDENAGIEESSKGTGGLQEALKDVPDSFISILKVQKRTWQQ